MGREKATMRTGAKNRETGSLGYPVLPLTSCLARDHIDSQSLDKDHGVYVWRVTSEGPRGYQSLPLTTKVILFKEHS